jgi:hypothetical protein
MSISQVQSNQLQQSERERQRGERIQARSTLMVFAVKGAISVSSQKFGAACP